jgi:hypothetical protein
LFPINIKDNRKIGINIKSLLLKNLYDFMLEVTTLNPKIERRINIGLNSLIKKDKNKKKQKIKNFRIESFFK